MTGGAIDPRQLRRLILEHAHRAGEGHIGSALSIVEIIAAIYGGIVSPDLNRSADRDMVILSKGHAALALYCGLHLAGAISAAQLRGYCEDGAALGVHAEHDVPGVDFSTGSLGQGLSLGVGSALAARLRGSDARTIVITSDAELNEGSTWEAIMLAGHHRLANLTLIVDNNAQQALAPTRDVLDLGDVAAKLRLFGWSAVTVDGHDLTALGSALTPDAADDRPLALVAATVAGRGVSFMEGTVLWHYKSLSDDEYRSAMAELG